MLLPVRKHGCLVQVSQNGLERGLEEKKWSVVYRPGAQLWDVEVAFVDLQARLSLPFH